MRWPGFVAGTGEWRGACRVLVGRSKGERPLGRPRYGWEDKIKMDAVEIVWECADRIDLLQDTDTWWAFVKAVISLRVP